MCIHKLFILTLIVTVLLSSCKNQEQGQTLVCDIYPIDFVDQITMEGTVKAVNTVSILVPSRVDGEIIYLVEDGVNVKKGDTVCIIENKELQSDYDETMLRLEDSKSDLEKTIANLEMQYANLEAEVLSNKTQTLIQSLDSLQLNYVSETQRKITKLELEKTRIQREKLLNRLKFSKVINEAEIKRRKLRIERDENRVEEVLDELDQMTLIAPQDGMAIRSNSWATGEKNQEGGQAYGNMPILEIPDLTEMKVTIWASEANYKRIVVGKEVEFSFDAMPGNKALGKITQKAPIGQPISYQSKVKVFEVEASIDSFITIPEPGLSARCKIILQNVQDTIVVPQISIFEEDSTSFVYVKAGKSYERHEVEIAEKSQKYAVISNGLNGDECISLLKPNDSGKFKSFLLEHKQDTLKSDTIINDTIAKENTNAE